MSALSVLRCDHDGCDRKHIKAGTNPYLRQSAESEGWRCGDDGDFCPWHIPAVDVDVEFEAAA